jgi:hypothetical protein
VCGNGADDVTVEELISEGLVFPALALETNSLVEFRKRF